MLPDVDEGVIEHPERQQDGHVGCPQQGHGEGQSKTRVRRPVEPGIQRSLHQQPAAREAPHQVHSRLNTNARVPKSVAGPPAASQPAHAIGRQDPGSGKVRGLAIGSNTDPAPSPSPHHPQGQWMKKKMDIDISLDTYRLLTLEPMKPHPNHPLPRESQP